MTKPDSHIESLLKRWGAMWMSEDLGFPHRCAYLKDYRPKGYKEDATDLDLPEVERLSEWMPIHLGSLKIWVLRVRYRKKIRNYQKASRWMRNNGFPTMSERNYRERLNDAYRILNERF